MNCLRSKAFPWGKVAERQRGRMREENLLRKGFALLHKPKDYRTYVRRRLRFVCLWGFLYLCQSVKNDFFDRLESRSAKAGRLLLFFLCKK